jgi:flavin reductase (DIM6/NTAB) family NADH-FMN oxidoreductase RutF
MRTETTTQAAGATHLTIQPSILYFGTPVALVTTRNEDGTTNIGPMSSAWALGSTVVQGWETKAHTLDNLQRERECVVNVPDPSLWEHVERLAPLTGRNPVPEAGRHLFRYEPRKFEAAGLTPTPSETVAPQRILECPLQLEAVVEAVHPPVGPDGGRFRIVETRVQRVHAREDIVRPGTNHVDTSRWSPLLYVFRHYFGTGEELGRTFRAED